MRIRVFVLTGQALMAAGCNLILDNNERALRQGSAGAGIDGGNFPDGASGAGGARDGSSDAGGGTGAMSGTGGVSSGGAAGSSSGGRGGVGGSSGTGGKAGSGGTAPDGAAGTGGVMPDGSAGTGGGPGGSAGAVGGDGAAGTGGAGGASTDAAGGGGGAAGSVVVDASPDGPPPCEGCTTDDVAGIFVEGGTGSDVSTCGGRMNPCASIGWAIARAHTAGSPKVYVAAGIYTETITLPQQPAGIRVEGAWNAIGANWRPICTQAAQQAVTIQAPATSDITVTADALGGEATLAWLTIKSKATANAGESLYGVFARGATTILTLENVQVVVAKGGDGSAGAPGAAGVDGASSGCAPASDGANGVSDGANGTGAPAGLFANSGYVPSDGLPGSDGKAGHHGTAPTAAGCVSCFECRYLPADLSCEMDPATPPTSCGQGGAAGCAGSAGKAGSVGHGGGSSIAVFAWDATVTVAAGKLESGAGGNGQAGGEGGASSSGASGISGTPGATCTTGCQHSGGGCRNVLGAGQAGGVGGTGGNGTRGGQGGGGAGGFSYAIYMGGNAVVTASPSTELLHGVAGTSLGNGAPGRADKTGP